MTACDRGGCAGHVADGYCDTCGRKPLARTSATPAVPARESGGPARTLRAELPDSVGLVQASSQDFEYSRICGKDGCRAKVGTGYAGQPTLSEGFCPACRTPFSFMPRLAAGEVVAEQYEVVRCLAHGGLGWIYLAKDNNLDGNHVVLKGLINTNDAVAVELARAERLLRELNHPNIVRIFNFVTHPDPRSGEQTGYIVMEHVRGLSLRDVMSTWRRERADRIDVEQVIGYGLKILAAMEYLHGKGLLYCDMKPDNVIDTRPGDVDFDESRIKIIDLGAVRRVDDRTSPEVKTPRYQVSDREIRRHGMTVRADLHTVGRTLGELFRGTPGRPDQGYAAEDGIELGLLSFGHVVARATDELARRFRSAAQMSDQLDGVLREIRSLRDGVARAKQSTEFAEKPLLLDAGLGLVPPLRQWTGGGAVGFASAGHAVELSEGQPPPQVTAAWLPVPLVGKDDPAKAILADVRAPNPQRLIENLAEHELTSVSLELARCRAYLELGDLDLAGACRVEAGRILGDDETHDWRAYWHDGLLALACDDVPTAEKAFGEVFRLLPGEIPPKLALGYCAELRDPVIAEQYYQAVWRRDRSQVSAAFGLARIRIARADRAGATAILDEVPRTHSRHSDAAMIAAVRVLAARLPAGGQRLPTTDDLERALERLPDLRLDDGAEDGEARQRLRTAIWQVALDLVRQPGGPRAVRGDPIRPGLLAERDLRVLLERSFRELARQARSAADHGELVDLANAVRPKTRF
ncbi:MAG TPA: tetratricopeptide repeat protein [Mycobacteriales bacterium]|nr:tetratricopeptide repeat protein [Mycobacteriales bacterium]